MNPKSIYKSITAIILSLVMAAIPTLQVLGDDSENATEYISEIKIGVGLTVDYAAKSLKGYTILKNGDEYADLNYNAGGGEGSYGDRVVLLGYKTTKSRKDAITDLAVMNMKGGYSVKDYELLMEQQMTEQIIPFVEGFLAAIEEYRVNYNSDDNPENKARATYVHDALNKLTDDDCDGAGLGDLLLNETKYEMGDAAYEALSEEEKKQHADILTIIAQANGKATLIMESLLTIAADTGEESWVDRFVSTTYDSLLELYPDMLPTDAAQELSKEYDDDAKEILAMWSAFKEQLEDTDKKEEIVNELTSKDQSGNEKALHDYDPDTATQEQTNAFVEAMAEAKVDTGIVTELYTEITVKEYLSAIEYGDGTLLDFFMTDYDTVKNDITLLYPLVASLSKGQRSGLEFVTLSDLIALSISDVEGYRNAKIDELEVASIYENVDRGIYKKGGVALTSEALRARSAEEVFSEDGKISTLTYIMYGITAASVLAFGASFFNKFSSETITIIDHAGHAAKIKALDDQIKGLETQIDAYKKTIGRWGEVTAQIKNTDPKGELASSIAKTEKTYQENLKKLQELNKEKIPGPEEKLVTRSTTCTKLIYGIGIAMIVLSAISLYLTYRDLVNYYNVDYTPIPRYMVDEKDITAFNAKGEKIVIKNQAAYYKAVECNRGVYDKWYETLGTTADLNATVGRQWLALYAAKNENAAPIIADSLKVVVDDTKVPNDYTTGIHMFGSGAAYNLNNTQLVWNNDAKSIFVYFNTEDEKAAEEPADPDPKEKESETETETDPAGEETKAPETKEAEKETEQPAVETTAVDPATETSTEGSGFSGGMLALSGGIGILVGALGAYAIVMAMKKKEE